MSLTAIILRQAFLFCFSPKRLNSIPLLSPCEKQTEPLEIRKKFSTMHCVTFSKISNTYARSLSQAPFLGKGGFPRYSVTHFTATSTSRNSSVSGETFVVNFSDKSNIHTQRGMNHSLRGRRRTGREVEGERGRKKRWLVRGRGGGAPAVRTLFCSFLRNNLSLPLEA